MIALKIRGVKFAAAACVMHACARDPQPAPPDLWPGADLARVERVNAMPWGAQVAAAERAQLAARSRRDTRRAEAA